VRRKGKKGDGPLRGDDRRGTVPATVPPQQRLDLVLEPDDAQRLANLNGPFDAHLRQIELRLGIEVRNRGNRFRLIGPEADISQAEEVLRRLFEQAADGLVTTEQVHLALAEHVAEPAAGESAAPVEPGEVVVRTKRGVVRGRSERQREYLRDIATHDLTFGIGPAGTGKTYLAVASAVQALEQDRVRRIVLTRPAVEAGEKLGFLPGDMAQKVDPYLRPLYDALYEMLGFERVARLVERAVIEVAPLAFMRGRAQPYFSRVLTPKGWLPIGMLKPGDSVIGSDGRPTEVLGVFPRGRRQVYRVTTQDGASTLCCDEHLWTVYTPEDRRRGKGPRTLETRQMLGRLRRNHQHRYELPLLSGPALFQPRHVPMDGYALGLLLGDGCVTGRTTPGFTTADPELAQALESRLFGTEVVRRAANSAYDHVLRRVGATRGGLRTPNPVTEVLRDLQLLGANSHTKFVPQQYLYNAPEVRLAVLQGLLDTDGGPVTQAGRTCRVQYTTTSPQLRDDVVFLVRSLGGVAYSRKRLAEGRRPGHARGRDVGHRHDAYVIDIRLPGGLRPFRLRRKAEAYARFGGGRPMRYIEGIDPVGVQDVVCIRVAAPDSLYVTDDVLLTHNTLNESFVILDEAQNTSVEQMKMFLTRIGFGSVAVVTGDVTQIDLPRHQTSGLKHTMQVLQGVPGIRFVRFEKQDVVRHPLVQSIVHAYEVHEAAEQAREPRP
jgi:phosphate starvation-inducible protein PhoH and related proteins